MTVQRSAIVISVGFVFSNRNGAYRRVETCSGEYRFCFEDTSEDHVVISGTPVNVTESEFL
jgi:hypothetical protein